MAAPVQVEPGDLDALAQFIREGGEPQPIEELALRFVELARERLLAETERQRNRIGVC